MNENVTPGIHPNARAVIETSFAPKENEIAKYWGTEWYITNAGAIELGQSEYKFFLIKPTATYEEALSLSREVIVILSSYEILNLVLWKHLKKCTENSMTIALNVFAMC